MLFSKESNRFALLAILLVSVTVYRASVIFINDLPLFFDEIYYYIWSQDFEYGYYSKPPMVAWLIALTTKVLGVSEFSIKVGSLLLYPATTSVLYLVARRLFDSEVAFFAGIAFATIPVVAFNSLFITTDAVLFFFWGSTFLFFLRAIEKDQLLDWIIAGLLGGCGLLSKYTMILFPLSAFFYLFFSKVNRSHLTNPKLYFSLFIGFLVLSPNLMWNVNNDFISFQHTFEISNIDTGKKLFNLDKMGEFFAGQFLVFGPIYMAILCYMVFRIGKYYVDDRFWVLLSFALPFLGAIMLQSFVSRANINWAAPVYFTGTILVTAFMLSINWKSLLMIGVAINFLLMSAFYHYHDIMEGVGMPLTRKNDPYKRIQGWQDLAAEVQAAKDQDSSLVLAGDHRRELSYMAYYLEPQSFDLAIWNPSGRVSNHFHMTSDIKSRVGENFLYITDMTPLSQDFYSSFSEVKHVKDITIPVYKGFKHEYVLYELTNFLGYKTASDAVQ